MKFKNPVNELNLALLKLIVKDTRMITSWLAPFVIFG